jgi:hypothetical protein
MKRRLTSHEIYLRNAGFAVADVALDPALHKQMAAALRLEIQRQRARADKFPAGRPPGAVDDRTRYIDELIKANQSARKPAALWKLATDKGRRGEKTSFLKRASERLNK